MTDLVEYVGDEENEKLRIKLAESRQLVTRLRRLLGESDKEKEQAQRLAGFIERPVKPPKWLKPKKKSSAHRGTVCAVLSDTHFDEVVNLEEMGGVNKYSREIAEMRLRKFTERVVGMSSQYLTGIEFDGCVLFLAGDTVSGEIHDELTQTNEDTAAGTADHWTDELATCLDTLVGAYDKLHVVGVVGNHGRMTEKGRFKQRTADNWDWVILRSLMRHFRNDERITFQVSRNTDQLVEVHNTRFLLTHGDQSRGSGAYNALQKLAAQKRYQHDFDILVAGHYHQLIMAPSQGLIVNGSLKGWCEYAKVNNFQPEPAQQACFVTTPEHGVSFQFPIFVEDRVAEKW